MAPKSNERGESYIKVHDSNGLNNKTDFEVRLSEFKLNGNDSFVGTEDYKTIESFEIALYTDAVNGECPTNMTLYNNRCFYEESQGDGVSVYSPGGIYNHRFGTLDRMEDGSAVFSLGNRYFDSTKGVLDKKTPFVFTSLKENTEYTLEVRAKRLDGYVFASTSNTFTTEPNLINNPYGNVFKNANYIYTDQNGERHENEEWMTPLISKEVHTAMWLSYNECGSNDLCKAIPEELHPELYQEESVLIGGKIAFTDARGKPVDVSSVTFALDRGIRQSDEIIFENDHGFDFEFLNFLEIPGFVEWRSENPGGDPVKDFILDKNVFNLQVYSNPKNVFKQDAIYSMTWQGYYSRSLTLAYMDYNFNGEYDNKPVTNATYYDINGNATTSESHEVAVDVNATFQGDVIDAGERLYKTITYGGKNYSYIFYFTKGIPNLLS